MSLKKTPNNHKNKLPNHFQKYYYKKLLEKISYAKLNTDINYKLLNV